MHSYSTWAAGGSSHRSSGAAGTACPTGGTWKIGVRRSRSACRARRYSSWPTRSAGRDCFLAVYGDTLWASAAFAVARVELELREVLRSARAGAPASPTICVPGRAVTGPFRSCRAASGFVLSTSGHIAAMVNPSGNDKARHQVAKERPGRPAGMAAARGERPRLVVAGLRERLAEHCGEETAAPEELGGGLEPTGDAPATYVCDR